MVFVWKTTNDWQNCLQELQSLNITKSTQITIFDLTKEPYNVELNFNLTDNCIFRIDYFCLNQQKNLKKIVINTHHTTNHTKSYIRYHGIGFNNSKTNLQLNSFNVEQKFDDIYSEQEIIQTNFDDAFFSGIPQINANNNSFVSAHKLMVGSLNQKELFYLLALGLNLQKSISILLKTLFTTFTKDENYIQQIEKELKNAREGL